ncbi:diguanylate cyclase [Cupriavidus metallidurans]|uniref:diguanylate cyclase n=1 Tax=Cupriavidus metallidurans TaxID=119219 RepID=UPI001CCFE4D9|nr:diguanylate cyclase [Cupriavidus metallidurans]UBM09480.1 cellulose biosynthesis regulator YedQ [Cupriavidus metallidurans]
MLAKVVLLIIAEFVLKPMGSPDDEDFHDLIVGRHEFRSRILDCKPDFSESSVPLLQTNCLGLPHLIACFMPSIASCSTVRVSRAAAHAGNCQINCCQGRGKQPLLIVVRATDPADGGGVSSPRAPGAFALDSNIKQQTSDSRTMRSLFLRWRAKLSAGVENNPHRVVLLCLALSLVFFSTVLWRGIAALNGRLFDNLQHSLGQTALGIAAVVDQEVRRLDTLRLLGESLLATQAGPYAVSADSTLARTFAERNRPSWTMSVSNGGATIVGLGPSELKKIAHYARNDATLMADLHTGRYLAQLLEVMVAELELEVSGLFVSSNGFYVAVPPDIRAPESRLERFASMHYYRDVMPDLNPGREILRSPVYLGMKNGKPIFSISAPLYFGDDFRGAVVLNINPHTIEAFLSQATRGAGPRLLITSHGHVIASTAATVRKGQQWPQDIAGVGREQDPAAMIAQGAGMIDGHGKRLLYHRVGSTELLLVEEVSDAQFARSIFHHLRWSLLGIVAVSALLLWAMLAVISRLFRRLLEQGEALRVLAEEDPLTGLANRRVFQKRFDVENERRVYEPGFLALIMIDIDYFKQINDTWGHANGDYILVAVAEACRDNLRSVDLLARLGGEEFAVLLPGSSLREAQAVAERLRCALAALRLEPLSNKCSDQTIAFTISAGVAEVSADEVGSLDALMEVADRRLYRAKATGRNRVIAIDALAGAVA